MPVGDERRRVPADVAAEVFALDRLLDARKGGLSQEVPMVLLIPHGGARGLEMPRWFAERLQRNVWATSGDLEVGMTVTSKVKPGQPRGGWLLSRPGEVVVPDPDAPAWEQQIVTHTVVVGPRRVRAAFSDKEFAGPGRQDSYQHLHEANTYYDYNPSTGVPIGKFFRRTPDWSYGYLAHGMPKSVTLPLEDGSEAEKTDQEFAGMLSRRPSVRKLRKVTSQDEGETIFVGTCWSGVGSDSRGADVRHIGAREPFVADPLRTMTRTQHAANATRNMVWGFTRPAVAGHPAEDVGYTYAVPTDLANRPGRVEMSRPEPRGAELASLAQVAGLAAPGQPISAETAERTLVLVRALRWRFGPHVDRDASFARLVRGIGGLERLRQADRLLNSFGGFTTQLFTWATRGYAQQNGLAADDTDDLVRQMLTWAGTAAKEDPGAALTDLLPGPFAPVREVAKTLLSQGAALETMARGALGLDQTEPLDEVQWSRVFWAAVEASQWFSGLDDPDAVAMQALNLAERDPEQRGALAGLATSAVLAGRDPKDITELSAYYVETLGAFGPGTAVYDHKTGTPSGRDWSPEPAQEASVRMSELVVFESSGGARAPYIFRVMSIDDHGVGLVVAGKSLWLPHEVLAELLTREPVLMRRELADQDVVVLASDVSAGEERLAALGRTLVEATGSASWIFAGTSGLEEVQGNGGYRISLRVPAGWGGSQGWLVTRPEDLPAAGPRIEHGVPLAAAALSAPDPGSRRRVPDPIRDWRELSTGDPGSSTRSGLEPPATVSLPADSAGSGGDRVAAGPAVDVPEDLGSRREPIAPGLEPPPAAAAISTADETPPAPPSPPASSSPPAEQPAVKPIDADPMILSGGVPRAALPQMPALLQRVRRELGEAKVNYTEDELTLLTHRLLANYRYLGMHDAAGETGDSGLQVSIGDAEMLFILDPTDPHEVGNTAGSTITPSAVPAPEGEHEAVGTINSVFATGAHAQVQSGQLGATRGALSFSVGFPLAPGVIMRVGGSIAGTANQSNRSDTHIADAEGGHVEDNRTEHKLIAYTAKWSFKLRTDPETTWAQTPVQRLDDPTDERLLLWIPDHYLEKAPSDQVIATGEAVKVKKLPSYFTAFGLTNIPRLFDEIAAILREKGLPLPMGSSIRRELHQELENLEMHLDAAVNTARGYRFGLHDQNGRPVAAVSVRSERLAGAPRVGATSDKSHLENVRTAIDGSSGSHSIGNSSALTFPNVEFDLGAPLPGLEKAGLGIAFYLSPYASANIDGMSAGRTGLHVLVPRDTSHTNAYAMSFTHRATVSVRGDKDKRAPKTTGPVPGKARVRVPEAAAYEHGLSVDREALKNPAVKGGTHPYEPDAIRGTGRRPNDPATKPVPHYVAEGKGVGMGLVMVAEETVERIREVLRAELSESGFLPADGDDPFEGYTWYGHGNKLDSLVDNQELFDKMVSSRGLDSHYDQIHQDGMTFTLRKRRGGMGMDLDVDSAKVTIKARKNPEHPPEFKRSTDEFHTVNLAMGMDSAGMSVSHSRKVAVGFRFKGLFQWLKMTMVGVELQRSVGASDPVGFLNNRPELLEYPGKVDEFALTSDYEMTVEYQHSGVQGRVRKGVRDPDPMKVENQTALAYLLPLGTEEGPVTDGPTPAGVLEQGVVYFLDTTGLRDAVTALGRMTDPAGTASSARDTFTSTIEMRAHLKEILKGEYTTDRPFEPGIFRDTFGAMDIRGDLGPTRFTGSTGDKFVLGLIKLFLAQNSLTDSGSIGLSWDQLDLAAGDTAGAANLTGETDLSRHWQHNKSKAAGRTGGKELLQLNFNRVYSFETTVDFAASSRREKHSKLFPGSSAHHTEPVERRTMVFLLPEPEALLQYAEGRLRISNGQLRDAMLRWHIGKLKLSGDLAAKILMRWKSEAPGRLPEDVRVSRGKLARSLTRMHVTGAAPVLDAQVREQFNTAFGHNLRDPYDPYLHPRMPEDVVAYAAGRGPLTDQRLAEVLNDWRNGRLRLSGDVVAQTLMRWNDEVPDLPAGVRINRPPLVGTLAELHTLGATPITSLEIRNRFNERFRQKLGNPRRPYHMMELPEYLTRDDPGGRFLGHSGIYELKYPDGRTTYEIVRDEIERVAPGLLAAGAEIWNGKGRRVGRMQGAVDALQAILAEGRDQAMWEEFLAKDGYSLYLVNPVGWFLTDIIEVNLTDVLTSRPEVHDYRWDTGIENYSHGYVPTSKSTSWNGSLSWMFAKLSMGGAHASGPVDLKTFWGYRRGTSRAENAVSEQTVYDWANHYAVRFEHELTVKVRRLKMSGRPLNNLLLSGLDKWTRHSAVAQTTVAGTLDLEVPHALAEAGTLRGPEGVRDYIPLGKLPGNAYVTGVVLDDLLPAARKMLGGMFGPHWYEKALGAKANDPKTRSSLSLPTLLSRSHLTNHLRNGIGGGRYELAENLFIPGHSSERATMWLQGDLFDAQVIGPMADGGTGTGRYIKHQSGTTANNSSDLARITGDVALGGSGVLDPQHPDRSWGLTDAAGRFTSANQNSAGTVNYRREQHAKELGSVLLVRMRGQFWLEAQKTRHHMFRKPHNVGSPFRSDPVTGDVYVEIFEAQYAELRAAMDEQRRQREQDLGNRVDSEAWKGLDAAPRFDLPTLLADAAGQGYTPARAHHSLVTHIREQAGGGRPLVLTVGPDAQVLKYRTILQWAAQTIREDLRASAHEPDPGLLTLAARYEQRLTWPDDRLTGGLPHSVDDEITAITGQVNRAHALRQDNEVDAPAELPPYAAMLSLDPVHLARDVAFELGAHVRLDVHQPGGSVGSHWADPAGRIHAFDPATFDDDTLTADQATQAGLWSDQVRDLALAHGLDAADLGRIYRTSWTRQQTFEQAVLAELDERRQTGDAQRRPDDLRGGPDDRPSTDQDVQETSRRSDAPTTESPDRPEALSPGDLDDAPRITMVPEPLGDWAESVQRAFEDAYWRALLDEAPSHPRQHVGTDPASGRPVRSAFDVRRVERGGERLTELTVKVLLKPGAGVTAAQLDSVLQRLDAGVREYFNEPRYRLPNGDLLQVKAVPADAAHAPHLEVDLVADADVMTQHQWVVGQRDLLYVRQIALQLGLRNEDGQDVLALLQTLIGEIEPRREEPSPTTSTAGGGSTSQGPDRSQPATSAQSASHAVTQEQPGLGTKAVDEDVIEVVDAADVASDQDEVVPGDGLSSRTERPELLSALAWPDLLAASDTPARVASIRSALEVAGPTDSSARTSAAQDRGGSAGTTSVSGASAPLDLRPASNVPAAEVYPFDPAKVRDWSHRALLAGKGSIDFYTWVPSGPDANHDFRINIPTKRGINDFARWLRGRGPAPSWLSAMNCWEFPLFTAYWVGAVDKAWLESIHDQAARAAKVAFDGLVAGGSEELDAAYKALDVYMKTLLASITVGEVTEHRRDPRTGSLTPEVPAGHLVFIDGDGHVAWALGTRDAQGRQEVLSHWLYPSASSQMPFRRRVFGSRRTGHNQKTTIEELLREFRPSVTVMSAAPAWSDSRTVAASLRDPRDQATPVPVVTPAKKVDLLASEDWWDRRAGAPVARVATERFDPNVDFLPGRAPGRALGPDQAALGREWRRFVPSLPGRASRSGEAIQGREWRRLSKGLPGTARASGWETLVRANVQRIQAGNGQWVRRHVVVLPVKRMFGVGARDVTVVEASLNRALDEYVNRGYELQKSKDQLHVEVKLVDAPGHPEAIEMRPGRTADAPDLRGRLDRPDTRHWGLGDLTVELLHEVLHYLGLPDEYRDLLAVFRRAAASSAVKADGLMAGGVFDPSQEMPQRYLERIESVVDATAVRRDHPLNAPGSPVPGADNPEALEVVGRADDVPALAGPSAPQGLEPTSDGPARWGQRPSEPEAAGSAGPASQGGTPTDEVPEADRTTGDGGPDSAVGGLGVADPLNDGSEWRTSRYSDGKACVEVVVWR
jgi:hypothetical protein